MGHIDSIRTYLLIFAALLGLTALTVAAAFADFGPFNTAIALLIAFVKAVLVLWFFMHVRHGDGLLKIFVLAGFFWLIILIPSIVSDYLARPWENFPSENTWVVETPSHLISRSDEVPLRSTRKGGHALQPPPAH